MIEVEIVQSVSGYIEGDALLIVGTLRCAVMAGNRRMLLKVVGPWEVQLDQCRYIYGDRTASSVCRYPSAISSSSSSSSSSISIPARVLLPSASSSAASIVCSSKL